MNTDVRSKNKNLKYQKVSISKKQNDKNSNSTVLKVKPTAISCDIIEGREKMIQFRRQIDAGGRDSSNEAPLTKNIHREKQRVAKLINSNEHSKNDEKHDARKNLDTYARITASRDKRTTRRTRQFAKPRKNLSEIQNIDYTDFEKKFRDTVKSYIPKSNLFSEKSKKK